MCFRCVHLQNTWEKVPETGLTIYQCFMFKTEITIEHADAARLTAIGCNNFYTGNDE